MLLTVKQIVFANTFQAQLYTSTQVQMKYQANEVISIINKTFMLN